MLFIHCVRHKKNFANSTQVLEQKIEDKSVFSRHYQAGTITIGTSASQNSGRIGEVGRQDLQRVYVDVPPTKLQKDQPQHQRTNQNDGCIHLLRLV